MEININNILIVENNGLYEIHVEFSCLPIETFETEKEARDFVLGYLFNIDNTEAGEKGRLFRHYVELDNHDEYKKINKLFLTLFPKEAPTSSKP